jgi:uncharacterized damage-inducible protein DinB
MTNKEFFLKVLADERPRFKKILEAVPNDKMEHKVHDKSRDAGSLAKQLAIQWQWISQTINKGGVDFMKPIEAPDLVADFERNYDQMVSDVAKISDTEWENGDASMGDVWKTKKYDMAWGFLFDAIHHRGQLSTYLRAMGAKVPSIYGPSADSKM